MLNVLLDHEWAVSEINDDVITQSHDFASLLMTDIGENNLIRGRPGVEIHTHLKSAFHVQNLKFHITSIVKLGESI